MIEINCRSCLNEFNASKFVLYTCLLSFTVCLAFRLDYLVNFSFFITFVPLWICELIVFCGFFIGFLSFIIRPPPRTDFTSRNDFFAMAFSFIEHCILTGFLLLCSYKLDLGDSFEGKQLSWFVVFTPLFILSFVSMVISVWSIRHDKTFEFELLFSINIIQFVFVSFKLDSALNWSWTIVFVPSWVLFTLCFIGTFYSLILAIFLGRHSQFLNTHRRSHLFNALSHFVLTVPLLIFFVMLANKLDALELIDDYPEDQVPFIVVFSPLFISLFFSLLLSFGSRSGNYWWYGMRKPFCNYIFESFTCLQQYANISYKFGDDATDSNVPPPRPRLSGQTNPSHVNQSPSPSSTSEQVYMLHTNDRTIVTCKKLSSTHLCSIEAPD
jgi:hypothetical protein